MEKIILIVIFIGGLRTTIEEIKIVYRMLVNLARLKKIGFHPSDFPVCDCESCKAQKAEDKEDYQQKMFDSYVELESKQVYNNLFYTIFVAGITVFSLLTYLHLIINF